MVDSAREETIANLCPTFQHDFVRVEAERFRPSEKITWAADASILGRWHRGAGHYIEKPLMGYWVLTSERLVRVWFQPALGRWSGRQYVKEKVRDDKYQEWRAVFTPADALSDKEMRSRYVKETQVSRIIDVNINQLDWKAATLFTIEASVLAQSQSIEATFWNREDANILYNELRDLSRANLPTSSESASKSEATDLLEALGRLRSAGVLTEDEFQRKKQELLDRI